MKQPYVLIVEDDNWLAEQYIRTLAGANIRADAVGHALAAIEAIDTKKPDALVVDMLLPGPNIFTLLHEIRSHSDLAAIPVILCTNSSSQFASEDLTAYGIKTVLNKATMHPKDIVAAVKKALP